MEMDLKIEEASRKLMRAKTSTIEKQILRDTVSTSQIQLQICEAELKRTKEQLKCLIHLVKRYRSSGIKSN